MLESPLHAAVDIEIIILCVVLKKGGPEQGPGKVDLYPRTDQEQLIRSVRIWKFQVILFEVQGEVAPGLGPIFDTEPVLCSGTVF